MPEREKKIAIIQTGVANTASVLACFYRLGLQPELTSDAEHIATADYVVLPGVGAFGSGMDALQEAHLVEPIRLRVAQNKPLLAVCLGMQLLFTNSEEAPGVLGLGIFAERVERFTHNGGLRVPQLGWNRVEAPNTARYFESGYAYFANSFCLRNAPANSIGAIAEYDAPFLAGFELGRLLGCQFHPELSGSWGQMLISRWIAGGK